MTTTASSPISERPAGGTPPTPERFLEEIVAFRRASALRTAIELGLFGLIAEGVSTVDALASRTGAAQRGLRALLNFLTVEQWLSKTGERYALTPESEAFLVPGKPAYFGGVVGFLAGPHVRATYDGLTDAVRTGSPVFGSATVETEHPMWSDFARSMMSIAMPPAMRTAAFARERGLQPERILDVAAGHGLFGIQLALAFPAARVTALDWPGVLAIARENAERFGVADRFAQRAGDARTIVWGDHYDLVVLPNFLHHFGFAENVEILQTAFKALSPGGRLIIVEFTPNEDRVSPALPAKFALMMAAATASGDAYTQSELKAMLERAGFVFETAQEVSPAPATALLARKA